MFHVAGHGSQSEMIQGWWDKRGDAIRQTSFGIVPGEESFMGDGNRVEQVFSLPKPPSRRPNCLFSGSRSLLNLLASL